MLENAFLFWLPSFVHVIFLISSDVSWIQFPNKLLKSAVSESTSRGAQTKAVLFLLSHRFCKLKSADNDENSNG